MDLQIYYIDGSIEFVNKVKVINRGLLPERLELINEYGINKIIECKKILKIKVSEEIVQVRR